MWQSPLHVPVDPMRGCSEAQSRRRYESSVRSSATREPSLSSAFHAPRARLPGRALRSRSGRRAHARPQPRSALLRITSNSGGRVTSGVPVRSMSDTRPAPEQRCAAPREWRRHGWRARHPAGVVTRGVAQTRTGADPGSPSPSQTPFPMAALLNTVRDLDRLRQIVAVLGRHGFGEVIERTGLSSLLGSLLGSGTKTEKPKVAIGKRLRLAMQDLGPSAVKLGQIMSTRPEPDPDRRDRDARIPRRLQGLRGRRRRPSRRAALQEHARDPDQADLRGRLLPRRAAPWEPDHHGRARRACARHGGPRARRAAGT